MARWTVEQIVNQIKLVENDNGSGTGQFLSAFINIFVEKFARNVDHNVLIKNSTLVVDSSTTSYTLQSDFLRPLSDDSFYVDSTGNNYYCSRALIKFHERAGLNSQDRQIFIANADVGNYVSAIVLAPQSETVTYWYYHLPAPFSASSQTCIIPSEYVIEGARLLYRNSNGLISKNEMDNLMFQLFQQASMEEAKLDKKIAAYIYDDPSKSNKKSFR